METYTKNQEGNIVRVTEVIVDIDKVVTNLKSLISDCDVQIEQATQRRINLQAQIDDIYAQVPEAKIAVDRIQLSEQIIIK